MFGTMRSAAVLAIGGLLATAMVAVAADPVEVTGIGNCVQVGSAVWSGEPVAGEPGSHESNFRLLCTMDVSDPRLAGDVEHNTDCDVSADGETAVAECWGTSVIHKENGAWAGVHSGTSTWSDSAPAHVHAIKQRFEGTGEYEGLRFEGMVTGTDFPWTITGTIESVE